MRRFKWRIMKAKSRLNIATLLLLYMNSFCTYDLLYTYSLCTYDLFFPFFLFFDIYFFSARLFNHTICVQRWKAKGRGRGEKSMMQLGISPRDIDRKSSVTTASPSAICVPGDIINNLQQLDDISAYSLQPLAVSRHYHGRSQYCEEPVFMENSRYTKRNIESFSPCKSKVYVWNMIKRINNIIFLSNTILTDPEIGANRKRTVVWIKLYLY